MIQLLAGCFREFLSAPPEVFKGTCYMPRYIHVYTSSLVLLGTALFGFYIDTKAHPPVVNYFPVYLGITSNKGTFSELLLTVDIWQLRCFVNVHLTNSLIKYWYLIQWQIAKLIPCSWGGDDGCGIDNTLKAAGSKQQKQYDLNAYHGWQMDPAYVPLLGHSKFCCL